MTDKQYKKLIDTLVKEGYLQYAIDSSRKYTECRYNFTFMAFVAGDGVVEGEEREDDAWSPGQYNRIHLMDYDFYEVEADENDFGNVLDMADDHIVISDLKVPECRKFIVDEYNKIKNKYSKFNAERLIAKIKSI